MVTQGTNEGGSRMNRNKSSNGQRNGYTAHKQGSKDGHGYSRSSKNNNGDSRGGNRSNGHVNRSGKPERFDKNKGYGIPKFAGKDDDEEDLGRRSKPSRPKESKPGVAIPDKNKAMLRLEKEQKTMKKKQNKKKESNRPQPKQKRSNNINYTKSYANGDYDDYEDYYDL